MSSASSTADAAPAAAATPDAAPAAAAPKKKLPIVCLIIGMAGSGKTTFLQRLNAHVHQHKIRAYTINLDPAVTHMPYHPNIDIRDTVDYKAVMKQYNLGPNGGIMTSLNLFATRFDQVLKLLEARSDDLDYIFIDTPGQIEVFTWSASGSIITDSLAATFPTCVIYVADTPRTTSPITFMSSMSYACSIMYKIKLPFLLTFNKNDVVSHQFAIDWMQDVDTFIDALKSDTSYMSTLTRSMSMVLEEFYQAIECCGVSALTGSGVVEWFTKVDKSRDEYDTVYVPMIAAKKVARDALEEKRQQEAIARMTKDMKGSRGQSVVLEQGKKKTKQELQEDFLNRGLDELDKKRKEPVEYGFAGGRRGDGDEDGDDQVDDDDSGLEDDDRNRTAYDDDVAIEYRQDARGGSSGDAGAEADGASQGLAAAMATMTNLGGASSEANALADVVATGAYSSRQEEEDDRREYEAMVAKMKQEKQ
jgi:GTPase SAR1 family protein